MAVLRDLFDLPRIVAPYLFHLLTAAEVFLPHSRPVSWFSGSNDFDPGADIPRLDGKVILVTGGNAGLGQETIYQLGRHQPAKIYLAARSQEKASKCITEIEARYQDLGKTTQKTDIEYIYLDLSDLDLVAEAANKILSKEQRLDIVILNAGIMATPPSKTKSFHDLQLGTNHIGHFLLMKLLLPLLERTAAASPSPDVRVVTVASEAYHIAPSNIMDLIEDHERLCASSNYTRYGVSKAANILFAAELARRYSSKGIMSVSLHPGVILTQLYQATKDANFVVRLGLPVGARLLFDGVPEGALGQLFLAAGAVRDKLVNGAYYTPVGRRRAIASTEDKEQANRLWNWTEEQVKDYLL